MEIFNLASLYGITIYQVTKKRMEKGERKRKEKQIRKRLKYVSTVYKGIG